MTSGPSRSEGRARALSRATSVQDRMCPFSEPRAITAALRGSQQRYQNLSWTTIVPQYLMNCLAIYPLAAVPALRYWPVRVFQFWIDFLKKINRTHLFPSLISFVETDIAARISLPNIGPTPGLVPLKTKSKCFTAIFKWVLSLTKVF